MTGTRRDAIVVVGAGLAGSLLAAILARRGHRVEVVERHPDIRISPAASKGRNIALSISRRGLDALALVGLRERVVAESLPKHSRMVHGEDGSLVPQRYGAEDQTINTVDRRALNALLVGTAERAGANFRWNSRFVDFAPGFRGVVIEDGSPATIPADRVIAADGCFSEARERLKTMKLLRSQVIRTGFAYREIVVPAADGEFALEPDHVHVWPRRSSILIALPRHDRSFCCNLFMPAEGPLSFAEIDSAREVRRLFESSFPDFARLVPDLAEQYFRNSSSLIFAVDCGNWNPDPRVLLIGDAAHAIAPFYAMGMNIAFEDCAILAGLIEERDDPALAFAEFAARRKPETDAMAGLSYDNFHDITKSPDPNYHIKWRLERRIWELRPDLWTPLYPMIAFENRNLAEVVARHRRQQRILADFLARDPVTSDERDPVEPLARRIISALDPAGTRTGAIPCFHRSSSPSV